MVTDDGVGFAGQNGQIQLPLDLPAAGSRHNRVALNTVYQMLNCDWTDAELAEVIEKIRQAAKAL